MVAGRARWIKTFLREEGVAAKLVHGSDFPVPPMPWCAAGRLGLAKVRALGRIWSFLERDVLAKRALGFPDVVFTNGARLIGAERLARWGVTRAGVRRS